MKKNLIALLFFAFIIVFIYKLTTFTYITAKFGELRPIKQNLPVYYKGLIIGKAKEMRHTSDYNHTLIELVLYPKNLLLPSNTTVLLKKEKKDKKERDFLELIYPKEPATAMLKNGSIIEGKATVDVDTFLSNQNPDDLEEIKENLAKSAQNLNYALEGLGQIFETVNYILKENQNNIYKTTSNVEKMTTRLDNTIKNSKLDDTLLSLKETSENISSLSLNLDQNTPKTITNIENTTANVSAITCGVRKTLRKKFGMLRLFFDQVIDECN